MNHNLRKTTDLLKIIRNIFFRIYELLILPLNLDIEQMHLLPQ